MGRQPLIASLAASFILASAPRSASASPQAGAVLTGGVAANGDRSRVWSETRFSGGVRAEVMGWRERDADAGFGSYLEVLTTASFHDLEVGAGASTLIPVHPYLPVVLSAGPYARNTAAWGWEPGIAGALFWGSRGFNYHSWYAMSAGIVLAGRYGLGDAREVNVSASVALDVELVALPFLVLWEAIRP